jgi:hypothetical protein
LIAGLGSQYAGISSAPNAERDAAIARGESSIELVYEVPARVADVCNELDAMLDEANEFCREGDRLLTLAPPEELVAFRRWFLGEFASQISGRPPVPWAHVAASLRMNAPSSAGDV